MYCVPELVVPPGCEIVAPGSPDYETAQVEFLVSCSLKQVLLGGVSNFMFVKVFIRVLCVCVCV